MELTIIRTVVTLGLIFSVFCPTECRQTGAQNALVRDNIITQDVDLTLSQRALLDWLLIFPGTKWCGNGDIAEDYDDLGTFAETDMCCRDHDFCFDYIPGFATAHGLTNPSFFSRVHCQCDAEFYACLKSDNSATSTQVGNIYFTLLGTKCFKEEYPIVSCATYSYIPAIRCIEYVLDTTQPKIYQWFDIPTY